MKKTQQTSEIPQISTNDTKNDLKMQEWKDTGKTRRRTRSIYPGLKFNRWTVLRHNPDKFKNWICQCDCGIIKSVEEQSLFKETSKSCGCYEVDIKTKHGKSYDKIYFCWRGMKDRCYCKSAGNYCNYGERGIKVCSRYKNSFEAFYEDMGDIPEGKTIDRENNNLHYSCGKCDECLENGWKFNCKWSTQIEQSRNKRSTVNITYKGETKCRKDWADILGMSPGALKHRIDKWGVDIAMTMPKLSPQQRRTSISHDN